MKKLVLLLLLTVGLFSFKSKPETICGINYSGVDSQGCSYSVVGTYDCEGGYFNGVSTFVGTITLSGPGDCYNVTFVETAYAVPSGSTGGGYVLPTGYSYAFYITGGNNNVCNATGLTWIGVNDGIVAFLNTSSKAFLKGIQKDVGCR